MTVNVVCLKWGDKYSPEYVNKLWRGVNRNLELQYDFWCITDDTEGLEEYVMTKELPDLGLPGWWNKVALFNNKLWGFKDPVLFLDLDIVILNSIDRYFTHRPDESFMGIADFYWPDKGYNSSVMRWDPAEYSYLWERFNKNFMKQMHGDQDYITQALTYDRNKTFPWEWQRSWKKGKSEDLRDTSMLVFHGKPDPADLPDVDIIKQNWI